MNLDKIVVKNLNFYYGDFQALKDINLTISEKEITAIIGPSGCGKSTLLRCFNRMNDLLGNTKLTGEVLFEGRNIYENKFDLLDLRKRVGMVFQRPNPFPLSIYENIAFGIKVHRAAERKDIPGIVQKSLEAVHLWDEVKDRLKKSALKLSLEQKQRLCIARAIAVKPEVLLMDEPCSALDAIATLKIEELMQELKKNYTMVIVTHNMQQAARISDKTGFMLLGELVEFGFTRDIFTRPKDKRTEDYLTGRFG
ncbi:MAG: phosphate ABC transporter ATP-binding protein PstB [Candidatus Omnitrophica bacterium]|nr:phosphate ABC transporter ATP-binding protein PstB [Candidatus Omnitrophota bacterium]MCM8793770.1 phosphate ABC transporter ATP-binding protein PstB [Candidatus Omnitrophota bacterium]